VVVGGQAVNIWAAMYLPAGGGYYYGSLDLDVLSTEAVLAELSKLPDWKYTRTPLWAWADIRHATMSKMASDGRKLRVEILHSVTGLEKADLASSVEITFNEMAYRVLDPVVMLKAKAFNVTRIHQDGPEPRQDLRHFHLLAKVVPKYLHDIHEQAGKGVLPWEIVEKTLRHLFKTMQNKKIAGVFNREKVTPAMLVPAGFAHSPNAVIRNSMARQMSLAETCIARAVFKMGPTFARPQT